MGAAKGRARGKCAVALIAIAGEVSRALALLLPLQGEKVGMRGPLRELGVCGGTPHPDPLPAGAGGRKHRANPTRKQACPPDPNRSGSLRFNLYCAKIARRMQCAPPVYLPCSPS